MNPSLQDDEVVEAEDGVADHGGGEVAARALPPGLAAHEPRDVERRHRDEAVLHPVRLLLERVGGATDFMAYSIVSVYCFIFYSTCHNSIVTGWETFKIYSLSTCRSKCNFFLPMDDRH